MTGRAVDSILLFLFLAGTAWVLAFAVTSAIYARRVGVPTAVGFVAGFLVGPLAWLGLWAWGRWGDGWRARRPRRSGPEPWEAETVRRPAPKPAASKDSPW